MPTRVTPSQVDEKKARIGLLKSRIETWENIQKRKDEKGGLWELIGPRYVKGKEAAEKDALKKLVDGEDDKARIAAGQAIALAHIINEVENVGENIEGAKAEIARLTNQIKLAREHGGIID